ncbi:MAG: hypothetical protein H7330_14000 [Hymenobacteraceae bacterium]|nr:hypothetical protein [Hymenobacteraceae bacterium]
MRKSYTLQESGGGLFRSDGGLWSASSSCSAELATAPRPDGTSGLLDYGWRAGRWHWYGLSRAGEDWALPIVQDEAPPAARGVASGRTEQTLAAGLGANSGVSGRNEAG